MSIELIGVNRGLGGPHQITLNRVLAQVSVELQYELLFALDCHKQALYSWNAQRHSC